MDKKIFSEDKKDIPQWYIVSRSISSILRKDS